MDEVEDMKLRGLLLLIDNLEEVCSLSNAS